MTPVFIVAVIFGAIVLALSIVCGTILMAMRLKHGGLSRKSGGEESEETRMVQDIYHGLSKLESRVDSLETILLDRKGEEK